VNDHFYASPSGGQCQDVHWIISGLEVHIQIQTRNTGNHICDT